MTAALRFPGLWNSGVGNSYGVDVIRARVYGNFPANWRGRIRRRAEDCGDLVSVNRFDWRAVGARAPDLKRFVERGTMRNHDELTGRGFAAHDEILRLHR